MRFRLVFGVLILHATFMAPGLAKQDVSIGPGKWLYLQETDQTTQLESFNLMKTDFTVSCGVDFDPRIAMRIPIGLTRNTGWNVSYQLDAADAIDMGEMQADSMGALRIEEPQMIDGVVSRMKAGISIRFFAKNAASGDTGTVDYSLDLEGADEAFTWLYQNCAL